MGWVGLRYSRRYKMINLVVRLQHSAQMASNKCDNNDLHHIHIFTTSQKHKKSLY